MKGKKKMLLGCLFVLISTMMMAMPVSAASAKLNYTKKSVVVGKTVQLKVKNTKKKVTWSSSNKSVASVSKKGLVTAKKAGKTTIKAKVGKKTLKCQITVKKNSFVSGLKNWNNVAFLKNTGLCSIRAQVKEMFYDSKGRLNVTFIFQNSTLGYSYTLKNETITIRAHNSKGKILAKGNNFSNPVTIDPLSTAEQTFIFGGNGTRRVINLNKLDAVSYTIKIG